MRRRIACLGWGSLLWAPGDLPSRSRWIEDGPELPIEYARLSSNGRVTLVVTPGAKPVRVLWCTLALRTAKEAREALAERENTSLRRVGIWPPRHDEPESEVAHVVGDWAVVRGIDTVVWAGLPPKWDGENGHIPTIEQVLGYLRSSAAPPEAEEYVRRTPAAIRTAYRERIEAELGWTPTPE